MNAEGSAGEKDENVVEEEKKRKAAAAAEEEEEEGKAAVEDVEVKAVAGAEQKDVLDALELGTPGENEVEHIYLDDRLTPEEKRNVGLRPCCGDRASAMMVTLGWCLFTCIVPLVLILLPISASGGTMITGDARVIMLSVGTTLAAVGFLYCCCISSFKTLLCKGVCCMPKGPSPSSTWLQEGEDDGVAAAQEYRQVKHIKVIANMSSAKHARLIEEAQKIWKESNNVEVEIVPTKRAGDPRRLAQTEALDGVDVFCVCGGDGSIHEFVNGFFSRPKESRKGVALGFLPGGSGNSVMHDLGATEIQEAARRIVTGEVNMMDLMELTVQGKTIICVNTLCIAMLGNIAVFAEENRCLGPARYNAVAAGMVIGKYSEKIRIEAQVVGEDGNAVAPYTFEDNFLAAFINLTQFFGDGLRCAPYSKIDDGLLEFYGFKDANSRGVLLAAIVQMPTASHLDNPAIVHRQLRSAKLTFPGKGVINVDGLALAHGGTVEVRCHRRVLPVISSRTSLTWQR